MRQNKLPAFLITLFGAVVFLIPIAWLASTALKPVEQTTTYPPMWLPKQYEAQLDGRWQAINKSTEISEPSCVVVDARTKERYIVPKADVPQGFTVEREIPASKDARWYRVQLTDKTAGAGTFQLVPAADLRDRIAPRWDNFPKAIDAMGYFPQYLRNTIFLCVLTVTGTVLTSAMAAYGFARLRWPGRGFAFALVLGTMMVPFPVVMVPIYCLFRWLGWVGTFQPLWVGAFLAPAFSVFLLRQFFMTIPYELSEAARIDGCGEWRIFWQIILPLSKPALIVVGLFQFLATWNDFLGPLIYLTDQKDFTLSLGLQFFQSQHGGTEWNLLMAACLLVVLPVLVIFLFAQRFFTQGVAATGLKG